MGSVSWLSFFQIKLRNVLLSKSVTRCILSDRFHNAFLFNFSDAPSVSRPTLTPTYVHRRGNARVVARCSFRILSRKRRAIISVVQFFANGRVIKTYTTKRFTVDMMEGTKGFKAGTTVRLIWFYQFSSLYVL